MTRAFHVVEPLSGIVTVSMLLSVELAVPSRAVWSNRTGTTDWCWRLSRIHDWDASNRSRVSREGCFLCCPAGAKSQIQLRALATDLRILDHLDRFDPHLNCIRVKVAGLQIAPGVPAPLARVHFAVGR